MPDGDVAFCLLLAFFIGDLEACFLQALIEPFRIFELGIVAVVVVVVFTTTTTAVLLLLIPTE